MPSADIEVTVNLLVQIDKLVQLIESPIFIRACAPSCCALLPDAPCCVCAPLQTCGCSSWSRTGTRFW